MKKQKIRHLIINDGYDPAGPEAEGVDGEDEMDIDDGSDVRLECLKLAVTFAKAKDDKGPVAVAKEFLAFVLAQEPEVTAGDTEVPDGRTRP